MNNFLRAFNRTFFCTYVAKRSLYRLPTTSNYFFARSSLNQRGLLLIENTVTDIPTVKMFSTSPIKTVTYENVKALKNNEKVLLIDVREPSELKETGVLPGSINIPLGEVEKALKNMSSDEFARRFGRPKPDSDFPVVFSCRSGKRSEMAATTAIKLGFKDVSNYSGGWLDWEQKSKC